MSELASEPSLEEQQELILQQLVNMYISLRDMPLYHEIAWRAFSPLLEELLEVQTQQEESTP